MTFGNVEPNFTCNYRPLNGQNNVLVCYSGTAHDRIPTGKSKTHTVVCMVIVRVRRGGQ